MRQAVPSEESHERVSERLQTLIERFERALSAAGIAKPHGHKVDDVIVSEAAASKAHLLFYLGKHVLAPKIVGYQAHFLEYIILPLSLIVLFVEAILEAVLHRLLSSIPSKAYL